MCFTKFYFYFLKYWVCKKYKSETVHFVQVQYSIKSRAVKSVIVVCHKAYFRYINCFTYTY